MHCFPANFTDLILRMSNIVYIVDEAPSGFNLFTVIMNDPRNRCLRLTGKESNQRKVENLNIKLKLVL